MNNRRLQIDYERVATLSRRVRLGCAFAAGHATTHPAAVVRIALVKQKQQLLSLGGRRCIAEKGEEEANIIVYNYRIGRST